MIKDDGTVIHFNNPKVQASLAANTFATIEEDDEVPDLVENFDEAAKADTNWVESIPDFYLTFYETNDKLIAYSIEL